MTTPPYPPPPLPGNYHFGVPVLGPSKAAMARLVAHPTQQTMQAAVDWQRQHASRHWEPSHTLIAVSHVSR